MSVPENYRVQRACSNCRHRFEKYDYDEGIELFCTVDGSVRPKCGSTSLEEEWEFPPRDAPRSEWVEVNDIKQWQDWSKDHEVLPAGYCTRYEPEPPATPPGAGSE